MRIAWSMLLSVLIAGWSLDAKALLIDDFSVGSTNITANSGTTSVQDVESVAGVLGGEREVTVVWNGPAGNTGDLNGRIAGDSYQHGQGPAVRGQSYLVYDGSGDANNDPIDIAATGLGGIDLTADGAFAFALDLLFADLTGSNALKILVYTDENNYSELSRVISAAAPPAVRYLFPFASFVQGLGATGAADFTNVGAIVLVIEGNSEPALDVQIDHFATVVPEPASLVLMGIGLSCFGMRRLRSRRQA